SGYLLKTDATEDKLYCILKTALKQWCFSRFTLESLDLVSSMIAAGDSAESLVQRLTETDEPDQAWFVADKVRGSGRYKDAAAASAARERLAKAPLVPLDAEGDGYAREGGEILLRLKSAAGATPVELLIGARSLKVPDFILKPLLLVHLIRMKSVRNLIGLSNGVVENTVKAASPFGFLGGWF